MINTDKLQGKRKFCAKLINLYLEYKKCTNTCIPELENIIILISNEIQISERKIKNIDGK